MTVLSATIGLIAGVGSGMPTEGLAFGLLHAVVPVAWVLDEAAAP